MLKRGSICVCEIIEWRVVVHHAADIGEVYALKSRGFEDSEICVVGKSFVGFVKDRAGCRTCRARRISAQRPLIRIACFKHQAGSGGPAAIHIHRHANFFGPRMLVDKNASAEQAGFLAVVHQKNNRMFRQRQGFERAGAFKHGGGTGAIVERPRAGRHRIVMGGHQYGVAWFAAVQARDHVIHGGAIASFVAGESLLHRRLVTQPGEFVHYAATNHVVLGLPVGWGIPSPTRR